MADVQQTKKSDRDYPLNPASYHTLAEIGTGPNAVVRKVVCRPLNHEVVAIKAVDLDRSWIDVDELRRRVSVVSSFCHPNILSPHCSFVDCRRLCIVMPFVSCGSLLSIMMSRFPKGLPEECIAVVLKETLKALMYLHERDRTHLNVKAGNILVDSNGSVKLADSDLSVPVHESSGSHGAGPSSGSSSPSSLVDDMAETPYWIPPEMVHNPGGENGFETDIWAFGVTALELAHGRPPVSRIPRSKPLWKKIRKRFGFFNYESKATNSDKNLPYAFINMVVCCLKKNPISRPTARNLLTHPFFKECDVGKDFLVEHMLDGLPDLVKRSDDVNRYLIGVIDDNEERREEEEEDEEAIDIKHMKIEWKFNEDSIELDPIMIPIMCGGEEFVVKKVRFGGETIIQDLQRRSRYYFSDSNSSSPEAAEGEEGTSASASASASAVVEVGGAGGQETNEGGNGEEVGEDEGGSGGGGEVQGILPSGGVPREEALGFLVSLKRSLEQQRQQVIDMITLLGGEVSREDHVVERFRMELDTERERRHQLELEMEFLRIQIIGAATDT